MSRRRTRPWAWVILAVIAGLIVAGQVARGTRSAAEQQRAGFVAGCHRTAPTGFDCGCLYDRLRERGYRSLDELNALRDRIVVAVRARDPNLLPRAYVQAAMACRGSAAAAPSGGVAS